MADCPIADECPSFQEQIEGMGCQHYGDRGGMEWCQHYSQPIEDLQTAPVVPGEEVVIEVDDMHESGAGVGRQEESGFIVMVDGVLPPARVKAEVSTVKPNYARAELIEKLPDEPADADDDDAAGGDDEDADDGGHDDRERLGSRDNFWGS
ncbi:MULTISPECIES: TRAM domain-containing protein [Halobacterium]|nr:MULTISPECIES: TRAM domain-containing protein [Halobacterium]MBB6089312.1 putative RNA-binding protein with TRAM domain [Halobacterium salinarum]MCF2239809.1 TRAM domain-containing protein [Halobacterium salinarum]MDL0119212.1 TRAM domain-containing protein [Halobacterium salinarum]MDL0122041.1 TRAM domain-containing protein [Halobacterium salinarum]MDL0125766.1 TRAM domain-containing protein [Halobacterium salinarum]